MTAYRLHRSRYKGWNATGAKLFGGRWNSAGKDVLYASSSLALASIEVVVHLRDPDLIPQDYVFTTVTVSDALVQHWGEDKSSTALIIKSEVLSRQCGDNWLAFGRTFMGGVMAFGGGPGPPKERPVQTVPSVIIPQEWNYLLDPNHPRFASIVWSDPERFWFDPRLINPGFR